MKKKPFEKAKPKTKKARFSLHVAGPKRVFLAGDFNGCVLVIPETLETHRNNAFAKKGLPSINFEPYM